MTTITTLKQAELIAGSLSKPSKMPGYAYGIPAKACKIGSKLHQIKGSVCATCYALKGRYMFPNVQAAQEKRLFAIGDPKWVDAMVFMIKFRGHPYFRWHDSGDLQDEDHLLKIFEVARQCPEVNFWLPTREVMIVMNVLSVMQAPSNLTIRLSATKVDETRNVLHHGLVTSSVVSDTTQASCPAYKQGGVCGACRACWDKGVQNVSYPLH